MDNSSKFLMIWTFLSFVVLGSVKLIVGPPTPDKVYLYMTAEWCGDCDKDAVNPIDINSPIGMQLVAKYNVRTIPAGITMNTTEFVSLTQHTDIYNEILEEALWITLESAQVHIDNDMYGAIHFNTESCDYTPLAEMSVTLNAHEQYDEGSVFYLND